MNVSEEYIAGFFDGDGCVATFKSSGRPTWGVRLVFYQRNRRVLDLIQKSLGCGRIHRGGSAWVLTIQRRQDMARVIPILHKHSIVKRKQLAHAYEMVKLMGTRGRNREVYALAIRRIIKEEHNGL